ncbi:MAG: hypothetical protein L6Q92_12450 [Phycisphaerae bacterium]|nr:hypothetical protein [Phycisphaerae bacterium]
MKRTRHSPEQMIAKLREADTGFANQRKEQRQVRARFVVAIELDDSMRRVPPRVFRAESRDSLFGGESTPCLGLNRPADSASQGRAIDTINQLIL